MRKQLCLGFSVCVLLWAWHTSVLACSCLLSSEENSYELADYALQGQPIAAFSPRPDQLWYLVWISGPSYKGCLREHSLLWVRTEPNEAACGVALQPGVDYLLKGQKEPRRLGTPVLYTTLCQGVHALSELTPAQRAFWDTRESCCHGSCRCAASERTQCLVDPCQVSTCDVAGAECRANYCGGCNAEWLDADGLRVCP
jgi:hypothetical protein